MLLRPTLFATNPRPARGSRFFTVLATALLFCAVAWGATAQEYVQVKQGELTALIQKPKTPENDAALVRLFDGLLDYDVLAQDSLAGEWGKLGPAERKEFQDLLRVLVQRAYTRGIRDTLEYDIAFRGESEGKSGRVVHTVATHKTNKRKEPVQIDYVVRPSGAIYRVVDIVTEGSSLVSNYKSQFRRIIEQKGFSGLLEKMRSKVAEGT